MNTIPIYQGEDLELEVTIADDLGDSDDSNDVPLDLDTVAGLLCYVYNDQEQVIAKYSLNAMADHDDLLIADAANGVFKVKLQAETTAELEVKTKLFVEVKARFEESGWSDDDYMTVADGFYVGTVVKARTKNVIPA